MAVIVVGDITVDKAEEYITKHFGWFKQILPMKGKEICSVPPYDVPDAMVVTDKEATRYDVSIQYPAFVKAPLVTEEDYKKSIIRSLFSTIFNNRLQELTQKENPPFVFGSGSFGSYGKRIDAFSLDAGSGTQSPEAALKALMTEAEKAKRLVLLQQNLNVPKKVITTG